MASGTRFRPTRLGESQCLRQAPAPLADHSPPQTSVGELTGGVICACLPVVFVLFKKEAKFGPWASLMRHIHARRNRTHDSIDDLERDASSEYSATGDKMDPQTAEELPQIPDATMIGHPCLIRREDHTQIPARGGWI